MPSPLFRKSYYHKICQQIGYRLKPDREASKHNLDWIRMQSYWKVVAT